MCAHENFIINLTIRHCQGCVADWNEWIWIYWDNVRDRGWDGMGVQHNKCKINCKGIKRQKHAIIIIEGYEHERDYDGWLDWVVIILFEAFGLRQKTEDGTEYTRICDWNVLDGRENGKGYQDPLSSSSSHTRVGMIWWVDGLGMSPLAGW